MGIIIKKAALIPVGKMLLINIKILHIHYL